LPSLIMALPLTHLQHQLQVAREMSLLGDYSSAGVYFHGVLTAVAKHMKLLCDPYLKSQWNKAKALIQQELDAVKEIEKLKASFARPGAGIQAVKAQPNSEPYQSEIQVQVLTPSDRRRDFHQEPPVPEDPDVWRPPTRGPPAHDNNRRRPAEANRLPAWARKEPGKSAIPDRGRDRAAKVDCWQKKGPASNGRGKGRGEGGDKDIFGGEDAAIAASLAKEVLESNPGVYWDNIAGLEVAKRVLEEAVVWPLLAPEEFTGLTSPPKGVLMYGPPGTGKTLLAKAVATEGNTTFFSVTASTLASKYRGTSERMVRILFELARQHAPSTIFIDEIDSLCSSRGDGEHEASRRVKTEFLTQIDGLNNGTVEGDSPAPYVMVLAATNFPWDLDSAMMRRLEKRVLINLPDQPQRKKLLEIALKTSALAPDVDLDELARKTEGYSGDDCCNICKRAAMNVMRRRLVGKTREEIQAMNKAKKASAAPEPICMADFLQAVESVNPSVSPEDVEKHTKWDSVHGSH